MKSIIISSNTSGGGKTTFTLGLMKALKKRGYKVQGYKVGPDYIDTAFHSSITGVSSRNLDLYLMGEAGVKASYSRGQGEYGVVEGVMGLYDGIGISSDYSTAHVSKVLNLPVVLVISPQAQCATLCAQINGLINFDKVNIAGIVLNNISESYYNLLKSAIEKHCRLRVFGYIPKEENLKLKSRHLGLIQSSELENLNEKIDLCSQLIEKYIDLNCLLDYFSESEIYLDNFHLKNKSVRAAVAKDKAFSFYYKENLELLEEIGEVVYFSPLKDKCLPENIDFLYLGGGYPEVFAEELSMNKSMLKSINNALNNGLRCFAECGGLMYLTESIDNFDMVGLFNGKAFMTGKLQNFGYAKLRVEKENNILPVGLSICIHEFHKSKVELEENELFSISKSVYDGTIKQWKCGYSKNATIATYAHLHFFSSMEMMKYITGYNMME
ncbi:MAG: cobyrinate a,c-diamide synthase [Bacillota bacterium]|nr:cobyrinate a,c-diamide synthase [Bacillota bacterium]